MPIIRYIYRTEDAVVTRLGRKSDIITITSAKGKVIINLAKRNESGLYCFGNFRIPRDSQQNISKLAVIQIREFVEVVGGLPPVVQHRVVIGFNVFLFKGI